jgi:hypothetical protein
MPHLSDVKVSRDNLIINLNNYNGQVATSDRLVRSAIHRYKKSIFSEEKFNIPATGNSSAVMVSYLSLSIANCRF